MTAPVLAVEGATKRFGSTLALAGASFGVAPGDWLGLLGPNGAGKTTLVRAVAGRVVLDAGRVVVFGDDGPGTRTASRRLGVVPQDIATYPTLSARENLESFGALSGVSRSRLKDRVDWALEWTGLAERAADQSGTFSGGMKRRLNLACAVLHAPDLLLLDEPTAGVDPQSRQHIWQMLTELREAGTTLVLTTHQLAEAEEVCERIVILDHGVVIADGTLAQLLAQITGPERSLEAVFLQLTGRELRE